MNAFTRVLNGVFKVLCYGCVFWVSLYLTDWSGLYYICNSSTFPCRKRKSAPPTREQPSSAHMRSTQTTSVTGQRVSTLPRDTRTHARRRSIVLISNVDSLVFVNSPYGLQVMNNSSFHCSSVSSGGLLDKAGRETNCPVSAWPFKPNPGSVSRCWVVGLENCCSRWLAEGWNTKC